MRVDVALTARDLREDRLHSQTVVVIDVFRAGTTVATALSNGCRAVIPARSAREARVRARDLPPGECLLGGEHRGEPIGGFDLGNSPLDYTPDRVTGKVVILTTSNGTRAMLKAARAAAVAVAGLVNVTAIARWSRAEGRDLTIICAGQAGEPSLEDTVCAGLIVDRVKMSQLALELRDTALIAETVAQKYHHQLDGLRRDSRWGRRLARTGGEKDLTVCLAMDTFPVVPRLHHGVVSLAFP